VSTPPDNEGGWESSWQRPQDGEWKQASDGTWYKDTGSQPAPASAEWAAPPAAAWSGGSWGAPEAPPPAQTASPAAQPTSSPGTPASGKAVAALVLGIGGLTFCPVILSVFALVLGYQARAEIDRSGGRLIGRGQATTGIVLGWIGVAIFVLFLGLVILGLAVGSGDVSTELSSS
jgi:hypothetical protein